MKNVTKETYSNSSFVQEKKPTSFFDFIVMLFVAAILVIDFLSPFQCSEIINPQFLYLSILNVLMGTFIYFNPSIIENGFISVFKKSMVVKTYLAFLILCALSIFAARNTNLSISRYFNLLTALGLFANLSILLYKRKHLFYNILLIVGIATFLQSFTELMNFMKVSKAENLAAALTKFKGNTGNINIFAASLNVKIPFTLLGVLLFSDWKKWFMATAFFFATIGVFLTSARASLISFILVIIIYMAIAITSKSLQKQRISNIIPVALLIIASLFVANSTFKRMQHQQNLARYESVTNRLATLNTKDASVSSRLFIWNNAKNITLSNPLLGIGLGNYLVESIAYDSIKYNDGDASLHSHNDFLEIFAETGIVNGLIFLAIFIFALIASIKKIFKKEDSIEKYIAVLTLMVLIVYGIDSMFNFPMFRPTMMVFFSFFLALSVINIDGNDETEKEHSSPKILSISLLSVGILTIAFSYFAFKASQLEYALRVDTQTGVGTKITPEEILEKIPTFPNVFSTSEPFIEYVGLYNLFKKDYVNADKYLLEARKINVYTGHPDFYQMAVEINRKNYDEAIKYSKTLSKIQPRHFKYYNGAIDLAVMRKNADEILYFHNEFIKLRNESKVWAKAATGLAQVNYDYAKTMEFINKGLELFPDDPGLISARRIKVQNHYYTLAQKYVANNQIQNAIAEYNKALKEDPKDMTTQQNLGVCYIKLNQPQQAIPYLNNALTSPELKDGKTEYLLGICYLNLQNKTQGCKFMTIATEKKFPGAETILNQQCK
ncbi:MAG: O-antigen ligase family protein [Flavobacterium sp.]